MALKLSKNSGLTDLVSTDGSNPITTSHPLAGSAQTVQLWLFNDDVTKRYEQISILGEDSNTGDGNQSSWIQLSSDGTNFQAAGASLSMANISNANTGVTFYVRVTSSSVASVQNKVDLKIKTVFTEFAV